MSIQNQPKLLIAIYALLGLLALIFAALLYINPLNFESTPPATRTATLLAQAESLRNKGDAVEAEKLCLEALKLTDASEDDLQKAKVYQALGQTYAAEKKQNEAEESYRKAIACLDRHIDQGGEKRLTLENLRQAQQLHAAIEGNLADFLVSIEKYDEAETLYRSAIEKNDQYLGSLELQRQLSSKLTDVLLHSGKKGEAGTLQVEAYASDYATKDLMAETKRIRADFESGQIDSTTERMQLKAISLAAQRKHRFVEYVDAETALSKALLESNRPEDSRKTLAELFVFVNNHTFSHEEKTIWFGRARVIQAATCLALHQDKEAQKLIELAGADDPILLFMTLESLYTTRNARNVEYENYSQLLNRLSEMAHLDEYRKKSLSSDALSELCTLEDQIGISYAAQNEDAKALRHFRQALEIADQRRDKGQEAELHTRLARIAAKQGRYADAEKDFERSAELLASIKPPNAQMERAISGSISGDQTELAEVYSKMQNEPKALLLFKKAADRDIKYGNWVGLLGYAQHLHSHGNYKAARPLYEKTLANLKHQTAPSKHWIDLVEDRLKRLPVFESDSKCDELIAAGKELLAKKNMSAADETFQQAEAAATKRFGKEGLGTAQVYRDIADSYMEAHVETKAKTFYERALDIVSRDKNILLPRANYINYCLCLMKDKDKTKEIDNAKLIVSILLPIDAEIESTDDAFDKQYLCTAQSLIAESYSDQKMDEQAADYYRRAVSTAENLLKTNPSAPFVSLHAETLRNQALNDTKLGKFDAAVAGYKQAISIWEKVRDHDGVPAKIEDARKLMQEAMSQTKRG